MLMRDESPEGSDSDEPASEYSSFVSTEPSQQPRAESLTSPSRGDISPAASVVSLTDSLYEKSFRSAFDRLVNNYSDLYPLPADQEEIDRLDMQHMLFTAVMGPLPPMNEVLIDDGSPRAVLDLGCGSGSWIADVAHAYPHARVVGVDLVPVTRPNLPRNCRIELDDINKGLDHFHDQFDVVNARLISLGIKDYKGMIDEVAQVVRHGGVVSFTESDFQVYGGDRELIEVGPDGTCSCAFGLLYHEIRKSIRSRGASLDAASLLHTWVAGNPEYEDVVYRELWVPSSPFLVETDEESRRQNFIGELLRHDIQGFLKSVRVLLLSSGMPAEQADKLRAQAWREAETCKPIWAKIQSVYARRRRDPATHAS